MQKSPIHFRKGLFSEYAFRFAPSEVNPSRPADIVVMPGEVSIHIGPFQLEVWPKEWTPLYALTTLAEEPTAHRKATTGSPQEV